MLVVEQLSLQRIKKRILNQISFRVDEGELVVIIGKNGSGKSSLLRCLSGWNQPSEGSVQLGGRSLHALSPKERAAWVSFLPQRPRLSESIPILDIVAAARYRFSESHAQSRRIAAEFLKKHHLSQLQDRDWSTLSGGEAQRIALICMRIQGARLWLLDEPANHLDPAVERELYQNLVQAWLEGKTLVVVTHNINLILGAVPPEKYPLVQIIGLADGEKSFSLPLSDPTIPEKIGSLYNVPIQRVTVFDREQLIFGAPQ